MPDIILAPEEAGSGYHLALTATYTAIANGVDANSATARLSRHGQAEGGRQLIFSLSGNAQFTQGGQQITVATDENGEATVYFTDTLPETVKVNCHYHQTSGETFAVFRQDSRAGLDISAEVITNHSQANGIARNAIRYSVYDARRYRVPSVGLTFSQDGDATLLSQSGQTNNVGQFTLELTSLTPERVRVTARLQTNPLTFNNTYLYFVEAPVFVFTSNTNINYALANGVNFNRITFTLTQDGVGAPNQQLSFTTNSPSAVLSVTHGQTNQNGQLSVDIWNTTSGQTTITAQVNSQSGIQPVNVIVTFSPINRIIYNVIANNSPANGVTQNQLVFTVTPTNSLVPLPNIGLRFSATNGANLSVTQGTTNANGQITLNLTSNNVGPVRVTATMIFDTAVQSHVDMSFV